MSVPKRAAQPSRSAAGTEEAELVELLRGGDDVAFAHLVRTHGPRMLATARRVLRNEALAKEALQDAFLAVHRGIGSFKGRSKLESWLRRIVTNAALMKLRAPAHQNEESLDSLMPAFDAHGFLIGPCSMSALSADQLIRRDAVRDIVRDALEQLPDPYRTALILRDIEGYSTADTADLLGVSVSAVKVRLHRARKALKRLVEPVLQGGVS